MVAGAMTASVQNSPHRKEGTKNVNKINNKKQSAGGIRKIISAGQQDSVNSAGRRRSENIFRRILFEVGLKLKFRS